MTPDGRLLSGFPNSAALADLAHFARRRITLLIDEKLGAKCTERGRERERGTAAA